jgi:hypothetical protein
MERKKDYMREDDPSRQHLDEGVLEDLGHIFHDQDPLIYYDTEDSDDYDFDKYENVSNGYSDHYNAGNFMTVRNDNKLDDLGEILKDSIKLKNARNQVRNSRQLFEDPEFLPNKNSLIGYITNATKIETVKDLVFERSDKYFGPRAKVYDVCTPNDIIQGSLGDCYFLAAISSIAEYPERIMRILLTKENDGTGIFAVALCLNGIWEEVILDDFAPCKKNGTLAFNRSKTNELWVVLLEKAWAKVFGGYLNISGGMMTEPLRDLTGASCKMFYLQKKPEKIWSEILNADINHFIMTASSHSLNNGSDSFIENIGICGSHAYSLLAVYQLFKKNGIYRLTREGEQYTHRILKLRNPWGKGEWNGEWSDNDTRWTPQLKKLLGFTGNPQDGIFFMPWKDFKEYYNAIQICYYHDNYKYSAKKFKTKNNENIYLKFTLDTPGKYYFSANQKNRRFYPKNSKYQFARIDWVIGQQLGENLKLVGSGNVPDKENWDAAECEKGDYYLMISISWKKKFILREFSFSINGPGLTELEQIKEKDLPENFMANIFLSGAREQIKIKKGINFGYRGYPRIRYIIEEKNGWGYMYFKNDEHDCTLKATVIFRNGNKGVKVLPPHNELRPSTIVRPGEDDIIIYKSTSSKGVQVLLMSDFEKVRKTDIRKKINRFIKPKQDSKSVPPRGRPSKPGAKPQFKPFRGTQRLHFNNNDNHYKPNNFHISYDGPNRNHNGGFNHNRHPSRQFESDVIYNKKHNNPSFNSDLRSRARNSKNILRKYFNDRIVPIRLHMLYHWNGLALLYVNDSDDLILNESILFNLSNAWIKGQDGNKIEFALRPNEEKFIEIIRNGHNKYEISMKKILYTIS